MAKRKKKAFPIQLDKKRNLRFDFNALCELEEHVNLTELGGKNFRMKDLRAILWAGLLHESPELTIEDAGELIDYAESLEGIATVVGEAFKESFGEKKDKDDEPGK